LPAKSVSNGYAAGMTKLLDQAVEKVQALAEIQDEAARMLLVYAGDQEPVIEVTQEEEADLIEALSEIARGEFASGAEVDAALSKYRL
jgi:predicted transcriptional regulator